MRKVWTCEEARFTANNNAFFDSKYPQCLTSPDDTKIVVPAFIDRVSRSQLNHASAARVTFGAAVWMAIVVHVLATEIYVSRSRKP